VDVGCFKDKTGTTNEAAETTDMETPDPTRPSRDPADATGDDERRPEVPTEPPDQPKGTRARGSEQRVEEVESRALRGVEKGAEAIGGDDNDKSRWGKLGEPHDEPRVESTDPTDVQVEPGGETAVE
jgi:hypothetical protein